MPIIEEEIQQNASKAAPTSIQQKRQHVAIVARVPDIISSVLFLQFVCLCQNTCPPTFSTMRTTCLPTDFQLCIENTKKSAQFSYFSKMPLQSTCFQIQFYLVCCSFFCSISRTPLSISSHFAIGRKFPLKATFHTLSLSSVLQLYPLHHYCKTRSKCILSHFSILLSFSFRE